MERFWMCYVEGRQGPTYQHMRKKDAMQECEKLAAMPNNAGRCVFLLEAVKAVTRATPPLEWLEMEKL